jgi:hypothetical protein
VGKVGRYEVVMEIVIKVQRRWRYRRTVKNLRQRMLGEMWEKKRAELIKLYGAKGRKFAPMLRKLKGLSNVIRDQVLQRVYNSAQQKYITQLANWRARQVPRKKLKTDPDLLPAPNLPFKSVAPFDPLFAESPAKDRILLIPKPGQLLSPTKPQVGNETFKDNLNPRSKGKDQSKDKDKDKDKEKVQGQTQRPVQTPYRKGPEATPHLTASSSKKTRDSPVHDLPWFGFFPLPKELANLIVKAAEGKTQ